jgi:putative ABC transport system substrate-binding protein
MTQSGHQCPFQRCSSIRYNVLTLGGRMKRREFITLLGGAVAWPVAARAQQGEPTRRIGVLMPFRASDPEVRARSIIFEQSLGQLGWTVGQDLQIDYRSAGGAPQTLK